MRKMHNWPISRPEPEGQVSTMESMTNPLDGFDISKLYGAAMAGIPASQLGNTAAGLSLEDALRKIKSSDPRDVEPDIYMDIIDYAELKLSQFDAQAEEAFQRGTNAPTPVSPPPASSKTKREAVSKQDPAELDKEEP